jgi:hypothetical protein
VAPVASVPQRVSPVLTEIESKSQTPFIAPSARSEEGCCSVRCHPSFVQRQMGSSSRGRLLHCLSPVPRLSVDHRHPSLLPLLAQRKAAAAPAATPHLSNDKWLPRPESEKVFCTDLVPCIICPSACLVSSLLRRKSQTPRTWLPRPEEGFCHLLPRAMTDLLDT